MFCWTGTTIPAKLLLKDRIFSLHSGDIVLEYNFFKKLFSLKFSSRQVPCSFENRSRSFPPKCKKSPHEMSVSMLDFFSNKNIVFCQKAPFDA